MTILEFIDKSPWWSFFALVVVAQTLYGIAYVIASSRR
jgi:putative exporter of polyketide antibiotics